ncbi:sugar ABC transporter permease [Carboxydochorda subterranea]|uniref:Sugar ABC transporter permease n=1 Tax=Carboxydichorda subterranea TaxID=3109565 RepID=A0ABZ1C286_9FIRM|nr:sugar ABC transporter permease [Limnochorda sp. L945t]WRP18950.1 sugar ABC transporter permease [Limnochorda sp. L945t]
MEGRASDAPQLAGDQTTLQRKRLPWWTRLEWREAFEGYLFVLPKLVLFAIFLVTPVLMGVQMAFENVQPFRSTWVGLENFRALAHDNVFWLSLRNTAIYTAVVVPVAVMTALGLASLIQPLSNVLQTFYRAAYYLPAVASAVVLALVWKWLFDYDYGLFNYLLGLLGVGKVQWLVSPDIALWSIILMAILSPPGAGVVLYLAAMNGIPRELYEAAEIDGASGFQKWWRLTVPLVTPTTLYIVVMSTIGSFQIFTNVFIMTGGGPGNATTTMVTEIYNSAFQFFNFGKASAEALVLFAIVTALAVVQFRWLSRDVQY